MSKVISFDCYREHGKLEIRFQEFRDFVHRLRPTDTALHYHVELLGKAIEDLKKALFEFQGIMLLAELEASVKQRKGENL